MGTTLLAAWQDFTMGVPYHYTDAGFFLQAGARVAHGQIPYKDFVFIHPPGAPLLMAAAFALCGVSMWAAKLPLAICVAASLPLAYRWLRGVVSRPSAMVGAVCTWAFLPETMRLPYTTNYTWAAAFFVFVQLARVRPRRLIGPAFWAGVGCGLAMGLKHNVGLLLGLAVWTRLFCITPYTQLVPRDGGGSGRRAAQVVRAMATVVALAALAVLGTRVRTADALVPLVTLGPAAVLTLAGTVRAWRADAAAPEPGFRWGLLVRACATVAVGVVCTTAPWVLWLVRTGSLRAFLVQALILPSEEATGWGSWYGIQFPFIAPSMGAASLAVGAALCVLGVWTQRRDMRWLCVGGAWGAVGLALLLEGSMSGVRALCWAPLALCAGVGALYARSERASRIFEMLVAAAWFCALAFPAANYGHVAIGLGPALVLAVSLGWDASTGTRRVVRPALVAVLASLLLWPWSEWAHVVIQRTGNHWKLRALAAVPGERGGTWMPATVAAQFAETRRLLDQQSEPHAPLLAWPALNLLHFYTGRPNPTPFDYYWPGLISAVEERALLEQLHAHPPPVAVVDQAQTTLTGLSQFKKHNAALVHFLHSGYRPLTTVGRWQIRVWRGPLRPDLGRTDPHGTQGGPGDAPTGRGRPR